MAKNSYAVKIDTQLLNELKEFCDHKGYKQGAFVEKALKNQMQREELKDDIFDLVSLKGQESLARPFKDYHRTRNR